MIVGIGVVAAVAVVAVVVAVVDPVVNCQIDSFGHIVSCLNL